MIEESSTIAAELTADVLRSIKSININIPEGLALAQALISEISHTQGELATIEITNYFTTSDAIAYMTLTQGLAVSILVREGFVEREIFDIADALHATQGNTVDQFILNQIDSRAFPLLSEEEGEFPDDFEP